MGGYDEQRVKFLQCQDVEDEQEEAMKLLEELAVYAGAFSRETIDASELVIGMKCGGSDGLSGITANPTVGAFSDLLISKGGTTILTEVPEMFGAETLLMNRCETPELFDKTVHLINDFKNYFTSLTRPFMRILLREIKREEFPLWRTSPLDVRRSLAALVRRTVLWRAGEGKRIKSAVCSRQ